MSWLLLRVPCVREDTRQLEELLLAAGAASVTLEDAGDEALLEPAVGTTPLWRDVRVSGLFRADADMAAVLATLPAELRPRARPEILEDRDWEREWMRHYRPMQFGERLWVCPSWQPPPRDDAVNLLLDPGLAFGTGTHATTALCLRALDGLPLEGAQVVDFGCGSGILAIAAARLGAARVLAVDNDPQALVATGDNAQRNAVAPLLEVHPAQSLPRAAWQGQADLVVANILAGPLAALRDTLCELLAPGGRLLLAGLLDTQLPALEAHYAPRIRLEEAAREDEWVLLAGGRDRTPSP